jgi:hypothetical protein
MQNFMISDEFRAELKKIVVEAVAEAMAAEKAKGAMLTSKDVMAAYHISRVTLWRLERDGILHGVQGKGKSKLYSADECKKNLIK